VQCWRKSIGLNTSLALCNCSICFAHSQLPTIYKWTQVSKLCFLENIINCKIKVTERLLKNFENYSYRLYLSRSISRFAVTLYKLFYRERIFHNLKYLFYPLNNKIWPKQHCYIGLIDHDHTWAGEKSWGGGFDFDLFWFWFRGRYTCNVNFLAWGGVNTLANPPPNAHALSRL